MPYLLRCRVDLGHKGNFEEDHLADPHKDVSNPGLCRHSRDKYDRQRREKAEAWREVGVSEARRGPERGPERGPVTREDLSVGRGAGRREAGELALPKI